jgi:hypothetical protein
MNPNDELHAMIREAIATDDAAVVAAKVGVSIAIARRWKAARGFVLPSLAALQRLFDAYAVNIRVQQRATQLWFASRPEVVRAD